MNARETKKFDKNEREMAFADDSAADYAANSPGAKIAKLMRDDIALVKQFAAGQKGGTDERAMHIDNKIDALDELKELMNLLDTAADALADDFPGIENLFGLPRNRSEVSILAAAQSQYEQSAQYEAAFVEYDLPAGFRARMLTLINDIGEANAAADTSGAHGTGSTGGLKAALRRLNSNSKKFDAINRIKYRNNPAKLGAWLRANHLEREPQSKPKEDKGGSNPPV